VYSCHVKIETRQVTVFTAKTRHPDLEEYESTFVRWRATGRLTAFGDGPVGPTTGSVLGPVVVAGRFVDYATKGYDTGPWRLWSVWRLNAQTGRREFFPRVPPPHEGDQFPARGAGVFSVVGTPAGGVAWILGGELSTPTILRVVDVAAGSRSPTVLASGPSIEARSLAVVPGHLYWSESGVAHQAVLK
jgi:hypothetical protein